MPWFGLFLNALFHWFPYELMNLQPQARAETVGEHPLDQFARIEQAIASVARRTGIFTDCWRKQNVPRLLLELMFTNKVARKFVIRAIGNDKLQLVGRSERIEVGNAEAATFPRCGTFHVHDLVDGFRHVLQRALAAGLDQHLITIFEELLHERHHLALLQHRLSASNFHQLDRSKGTDSAQHFIDREFVSAGKGELAVAPRAAQIAPRKPHEDAWQSCEGGLALDGFVDFDETHRLGLYSEYRAVVVSVS